MPGLINFYAQVTSLPSLRSEVQTSGWCCMPTTSLQILLIFSSPGGYRLQFSIPHAYFVYMGLYWPTLQFYVYVYVSFASTWCPMVSVNTTLLCCNYCSSLSVVLHAFSALRVSSKSGHHPHPLGYLCAKFHFFHGLHCSANPWRKIAYSITHSPSLFDAPGIEACASE